MVQTTPNCLVHCTSESIDAQQRTVFLECTFCSIHKGESRSCKHEQLSITMQHVYGLKESARLCTEETKNHAIRILKAVVWLTWLNTIHHYIQFLIYTKYFKTKRNTKLRNLKVWLERIVFCNNKDESINAKLLKSCFPKNKVCPCFRKYCQYK